MRGRCCYHRKYNSNKQERPRHYLISVAVTNSTIDYTSVSGRTPLPHTLHCCIVRALTHQEAAANLRFAAASMEALFVYSSLPAGGAPAAGGGAAIAPPARFAFAWSRDARQSGEIWA